MEKQIKMSLETARKMYNDVNLPNYLTRFVLENFTTEELEGKEGFTAEDLGIDMHDGYYIDYRTGIGLYTRRGVSSFLPVFKTESQAKSALAFAQLTHIVDKYNEGKYPIAEDGFTSVYQVQGYTDGKLGLCKTTPFHSISFVSALDFHRHEDAKTSMRVNEQLWKDYYMINSVKATVVSS